MTETKEEEKVVLHNRGTRVINTPYGQLAIGGSLEVPASAAAALLDYRGIVDAAKLVPQNTQRIDQYKGRVAELEAENAKLRKENDAVKEPPKPSEFEKTVKAPPPEPPKAEPVKVAHAKTPVKEPAKAGKKGR